MLLSCQAWAEDLTQDFADPLEALNPSHLLETFSPAGCDPSLGIDRTEVGQLVQRVISGPGPGRDAALVALRSPMVQWLPTERYALVRAILDSTDAPARLALLQALNAVGSRWAEVVRSRVSRALLPFLVLQDADGRREVQTWVRANPDQWSDADNARGVTPSCRAC